MDKDKLREQMRKRLQTFRENKEDHQKRTASLNGHISHFLRQKQGVWAGYVPLSSEPNILQVIDNTPHIQWVYPRVVDQDLVFHKAQKRDAFVASAFGVLEPQTDQPHVDAMSVDGFLVPGVAFGRDGARLGRGKGFYDRILKQTSAAKVGVCFSLQLFNKGFVPTSSEDEFLDLMITDEGVQTCSRSTEER